MKLKIFLLVNFIWLSGFAQENLESILNNYLPFSEKQNLARDYFHCEMEDSVNAAHGESDDEYSEYKRWEWISQKLVQPDGFQADPLHDFNIRNKFIKNKSHSSGTWQSIGQTDLSNTPGGIGRVNSVACHPVDSNTLYIGTFCGGIWKTTDGGNHWIALGDGLPICSVGSICIDYLNPNIIYIVLGFNLNNNAGLGIYKSIDGGVTWNPTGQTSTVLNQIVYRKLIIHPTNPNILLSCQSNGLWETTNGGLSWTLINSLEFTDLKFNPLNANTIYASGMGFGSTPSQIFKSMDGGNGFTQLTHFTGEYFLKFSITEADTNYMAVRSTSGSTFRFYLSTDGVTFNLQNGNNSIDKGGEVLISATNKNRMYAGYPGLHLSTDSGVTWPNSISGIHVDTRSIVISPVNKNIIYICNDGGIYKLNDSTGNFTNLSNTLDITMFYDVSLSQQDSVTLLGGSQDNGSRLKNSNGIWRVVGGGDGMISAVNPLNDQTMYSSEQYGSLYRTYDQWQTAVIITPPGSIGSWTTPYKLDPANPAIIYAGYGDVMKSVNEGSSWNAISNLSMFSFTGKINFLDVSAANSDYIYCCTRYYDEIFYTPNGGNSWTKFSAPQMITDYVSGIIADPKNPNRIFILKDGYVDHDKILTTSDQGLNWKNISYNLPNVPILCMTINQLSDSANLDYYLGTTIGVFYKKDLDTTWNYLGNGLPNTFVTDLEIRFNYNKLIAATYGHGIWQIDQPYQTSTGISDVSNKNGILLLNNVIANGELRFESYLGTSSPASIVIYDLYGKSVLETNQSITQGINKLSIPDLANGNYFIRISNAKINQVSKFIVSR